MLREICHARCDFLRTPFQNAGMPVYTPGKGEISDRFARQNRQRMGHIDPAKNCIHAKPDACLDGTDLVFEPQRNDLKVGNGTRRADARGQVCQTMSVETNILEADMTHTGGQGNLEMRSGIGYRPVIAGQHEDEIGTSRLVKHVLSPSERLAVAARNRKQSPDWRGRQCRDRLCRRQCRGLDWCE